MINSIKPINIILFDTYIIAILYLAFTWQFMDCSTQSNLWQLFYYMLLTARLFIDEMQNNQIINKTQYYFAIMFSSVSLVAISIFECVNISEHASSFNREDHMACFQNRILLIGECIFAFLIMFKDTLVILYERSKEAGQLFEQS